jgi:Zn-dependent alcohol dehydrogenase
MAVLAASQLGAERIIAMSRHEALQKLALEFGATASSPSGATRESPASRS